MAHAGSVQARIEGIAYPGGSSRRLGATLTSRVDADDAAETALEILDEHGSVVAATLLRQVTLDPRLGSGPRRMTFPDGTLFETEDHAAVEALAGHDGWSWLHAFEQFHPRLILITIGALIGMVVVYRFVLNWLVVAAVALTPDVLVDQIDRGTMQTIDLVMADETRLSAEQQAVTREVFDQVVAALPARTRDRHQFQVLFRDIPRMGPNAFALPGGTIVFTDQFLEMFGDDDIVAAVVGHELGHVVEQHGLQQLYRALGLYFLITMLAGETGPMLEDLLLEGNALLSLSYSRHHEREADAFGLQLSHRAGFDPSALKRFFEQMNALGGAPPEFLSSHPSSGKRMDAIDQIVEELR